MDNDNETAPTTTPTNISFHQTLVGRQIRPNAQMPIAAHQVCGRLLKQLTMAIEFGQAGHKPVAIVRDWLDEWLMRERQRAMPGVECEDSGAIAVAAASN
jgi:hypothetical protein